MIVFFSFHNINVPGLTNTNCPNTKYFPPKQEASNNYHIQSRSSNNIRRDCRPINVGMRATDRQAQYWRMTQFGKCHGKCLQNAMRPCAMRDMRNTPPPAATTRFGPHNWTVLWRNATYIRAACGCAERNICSENVVLTYSCICDS